MITDPSAAGSPAQPFVPSPAPAPRPADRATHGAAVLLVAGGISLVSVQDRDAAAAVVVLACAKPPGLKKLYAHGACGGKCAQAIEQTHALDVEAVRHPGNRSTGTWQDAQQPPWPEVVA